MVSTTPKTLESKKTTTETLLRGKFEIEGF
jgi:hypothetical protein